jgi:hypothetical protein
MASRSVTLDLDEEAQDAIASVGRRLGTADIAEAVRLCLGGYTALLHYLDTYKGSKFGLILESGEYLEVELCNEGEPLDNVIELFPLEAVDKEIEEFLDAAGSEELDEAIALPPLEPDEDMPEVTQQRVDEALDNALESDYDYRNYDNYEALAIDIGTYAAELEGAEPEQLIPLIKDWQARHQ